MKKARWSNKWRYWIIAWICLSFLIWGYGSIEESSVDWRMALPGGVESNIKAVTQNENILVGLLVASIVGAIIIIILWVIVRIYEARTGIKKYELKLKYEKVKNKKKRKNRTFFR